MIKLYWIEVIKGFRIAAYIAFICFAVSIYKVSTVSWFLIHANHAQGEVISVIDWRGPPTLSSGPRGTHIPVIEFSASDGRTVQVVSKTDFNSDEIDQLKKNGVKLFYNPNNPQDAKLGLFKDLWYFQACLFLFGLLVVFVDYWIFLFDAPLLIHKQDNVVDLNKQ